MPRPLANLEPDEFENLIFDLAQALGLKNAVWRTPGRDGGRDIQGNWFTDDLSGHTASQSWYIECKRYEASVGWPLVWEKIAYAESNDADLLLFAVTSSLSPQAVSEVTSWNSRKRRPIVRYWNRADIESRLRLYPGIAIKYGLAEDPHREMASSLLPLINILLKYSNAAYSAEEFEIPAHTKIATVYALSELIAAKMADIKSTGTIHSCAFRAEFDDYEWLIGGNLLEDLQIDRLSFRAIACYVRDLFRVTELTVTQRDREILIIANTEVPVYVQDDLNQIAVFSNFELRYDSQYIILGAR